MAGSHPGACGGCTLRWDSPSQAHCPVCHQHFGSSGSFDKHLPPTEAPAGAPCKDPVAVGLRMVDGIWRGKADLASLERMRMARQAKADLSH